jgi:hypothetical protein
MSIDLSNLLPADTATYEVLKPGGIEATGWVVTFAGPSHPRAVAWANEAARKGLREAKQIKDAQINGRKFKGDDKEPDDVRRENVQWVTARIVGWDPAPDFGDGPIEFSDKAATDLLIKPEMGWVFSQFVDFLGNDTSFTQRSA